MIAEILKLPELVIKAETMEEVIGKNLLKFYNKEGRLNEP